MKSILVACLVGMVADTEPEVAVSQIKVSEQKVEVTVGSLRVNGFGWIDKSAIVIDQEGYCWIKRAAEVYGDKSPTGIQITRTDKGYGLIVIVDHGDGWMSLYANNDALLKDGGDWVRAGEPIATVGSSGGQGRAALYFELRQGSKPVDPRSWLKRR